MSRFLADRTAVQLLLEVHISFVEFFRATAEC